MPQEHSISPTSTDSTIPGNRVMLRTLFHKDNKNLLYRGIILNTITDKSAISPILNANRKIQVTKNKKSFRDIYGKNYPETGGASRSN
jgi:hypothetical protein